MQQINENAKDNLTVVLCGNKLDLESERTVSKDMGTSMANNLGYTLYEISAKSGTNVEECLHGLISKVVENGKDNLKTKMINKNDKLDKNNGGKSCEC
mmetsp:Transcript_60912/g.131958  ORF Transcript_60912/g.131958 Transcript_60912/m.131958 type:complete len:98 (+) Transcript_60912:302-595(+)